MRISVTKREKAKMFGQLVPGDAFWVIENTLNHDAGSPDEPYLKICDSHGESNGAAFSLTNLYEDEFDDKDLVGIYSDFEFIGNL